MSISYAWNKCEKTPFEKEGEHKFIKLKTTHEYENLASMQVYGEAGEAFLKQYCVDLYEHYNFQGQSKSVCLDVNNKWNYMEFILYHMSFGDLTSSLKVGSMVKTILYTDQPSKGL